MNARDTMALLGYAAMLDDTVDLRDESNGMSGGDPVRTLMNEVQRIEAEIVRLKIAHLRRMDTCILRVWGGLPMRGRTIRNARRFDRLRCAVKDKITELKESQCSTKS